MRKTNLCHRVPHLTCRLAPPKAPSHCEAASRAEYGIAPLQKSQDGLRERVRRGGPFSPTQPRARAHAGRQSSQDWVCATHSSRGAPLSSPGRDPRPRPGPSSFLPLPGASESLQVWQFGRITRGAGGEVGKGHPKLSVTSPAKVAGGGGKGLPRTGSSHFLGVAPAPGPGKVRGLG